MKVAMVGWVYEASAEQRARQLWAPETALAAALRRQGHEVTETGHLHATRATARGMDVVHVHFLGPGFPSLWTTRRPLVFTKHLASDPTFKQSTALHLTGLRSRALVSLGPNEARTWPRPLRRKLVPIANAVNVEPFAAVRHHRQLEDPVRLLFAGALLPVKRVEVIVTALARLQHRGLRATLTIASHRPTEGPTLRRLATELGVGSMVEWVAPRGPEELAAVYAGAHLLILASWGEGRPTVIAEGLLTGLPVVSPDVGEVAHQVGRAGVIVAAGVTADDLAVGIETAVLSYSSLAAEAFAIGPSVAAECDPDEVARRHVEVYRAAAGIG